MKICIKFVVDDPSGEQRTFMLRTDRPYPVVPRAGEWITPDDTGQMAPREIRRVVYEPDGSLTLELDPGLPTEDPQAFIMVLETVGFEEVEPRHLP